MFSQMTNDRWLRLTNKVSNARTQRSCLQANSQYMRFSDVADVLETGPRTNERKSSVDSLKGQLPWSYIASSSSNGDTRSTEDRTFYLSDSVNRNKRKAIYSESESHTVISKIFLALNFHDK